MAFNPMRNILHDYATYTYKIRLYRVPSDEHADVLGNGSEFEGINLLNIHTYGFSKRVVIAESGSTALNINSISMTTNVSTDHSDVATIAMQITQPKGFSLFEALIKAAELAGDSQINSLTSASYWLEINFMGMDDDGTEALNIYTVSYPVQFAKVNMSMGISGAVYDVSLTIGTVSSRSRDNFSRIPSTIQLTDIHTTDDFFSKLESAINTAYERDTTYRQRFTNVCEFVIDDELQGLDFDIDITNRPIGDMLMTADDNTGVSFHIPVSYSIGNVVESVLGNVKEVREMLLSEDAVGKVLHVEPHVVPEEYDDALQSYIYKIYWMVSLRYCYKEVRPDMSDNNNLINLLEENGDLSKAYNYIYTGVNTEVKNISLDFNDIYSLQLNSYKSIFQNYANNSVLSTDAPEDRDEIFENEREEAQEGNNNATPTMVDSTGAEVYYVDDFSEISEDMVEIIAPRFQKENTPSNGYEGLSNLSADSERSAYMQEIRNVSRLQHNSILPTIEIEIRGDPHWLIPRNVYFAQVETMSNRRQMGLIYVRVGFPVDETLEDIHVDDFLSAIYLVDKVKNEFNNGVFSQTIKASRVPHIRRSAVESRIEDD